MTILPLSKPIRGGKMEIRSLFCITLTLVLAACAPPTPSSMPTPPSAASSPSLSPSTSVPIATAIPALKPTPIGGGGGKIVYVATTSASSQNIFVMDVDGSNPQQITNLPGTNTNPAWSPDGKRIAFSANPKNENRGARIVIMNADGSNLTPVTNFSSGMPHWSADGKRLVFESDRDAPTPNVPEIYIVGADGSNPVRLTNAPTFHDAMPRWSPDGQRIGFWSNRDGNPEIYVTLALTVGVNADGGNVVRLTNNPASDDRPIWSPDGKRIAFVSDRDGNCEIYVMNADGSNQTRLTNNPARDVYPVWSPDGTRIMFVSNRDGAFDIYSLGADGSNVMRVTKTGGNIFPDWQP
jgi:Tol biopolymer transport system component